MDTLKQKSHLCHATDADNTIHFAYFLHKFLFCNIGCMQLQRHLEPSLSDKADSIAFIDFSRSSMCDFIIPLHDSLLPLASILATCCYCRWPSSLSKMRFIASEKLGYSIQMRIVNKPWVLYFIIS